MDLLKIATKMKARMEIGKMAKRLYLKQAIVLISALMVFMLAFTNFHQPKKSIYNENNDKIFYNASERIVIGTVSCHKPNKYGSNLETAVMIKSVLISAQFSKVTNLDFHIFLEYLEEISYFSQKLQEYGCENGNCKGVQVNITYYSAIITTLIPEKYHRKMIYDRKLRCGFVRMFFPSALPDIDSIIYLDTDIIVTGNTAKIWQVFGEMNDRQLIGIPRDKEGDNPYFLTTYWSKSDIPRVPPEGLNTGILLMNLTKMRQFGWEEKLLRLHDDYSQIYHLTVQRIINVLLYYNPGLYKLLTCEYHIFNKNCDKGLYCDYLEGSPDGIHVIHGAANTFATPNESLYDIFETYRIFNMTHGNFVNDVATKIRKIYGSPQKANVTLSKCYSILNKYLFNYLFDDKDNLITNA